MKADSFMIVAVVFSVFYLLFWDTLIAYGDFEIREKNV